MMDISSLFAFSLSFLVVLSVVWKVGSPLFSEEPESEADHSALVKTLGEVGENTEEMELREDYLSGKIDSEEFNRYVKSQ